MLRILRLIFKPGYLKPNPYERNPMTDILARIKVVLSAAVTWLVVASSVVTIFADEIAPLIPAPWSERVSAIAVTVLGVLAAAIAIIRRVTPVLPDERGILPQ